VSGAAPLHRRMGHRHLHLRARRHRVPAVPPRRVQRERGRGDHLRADAHRAPHRIGQGGRDFGDVDHHRVAVPSDCAGADAEMVGAAVHPVRRSLGHRPGGASGAVQGDVDRAVVVGRAPARQLVIGREDAADKGDDGQPVGAVRAGCVDIPPGIAVGRDRDVETRSLSKHSAASRPESAAIGTPAPGWVLPPAQ
jgi:hypothetical protein